MSSKAVRDAFEAGWLIAMPGLDLEADRTTLADQWATADYSSFGEQRVSLGETACRRETGLITVIVFIKAGEGDAQAVTLADSVRDAFRDWKDPTGNITINRVDPGETGEGSDGRWFAASVNLTYTFDQYI